MDDLGAYHDASEGMGKPVKAPENRAETQKENTSIFKGKLAVSFSVCHKTQLHYSESRKVDPQLSCGIPADGTGGFSPPI